MQTALWDAPEVVRILSAMFPQNVRNERDTLSVPCPTPVRSMSERARAKCEIIGALFRTWTLFDTHSDNGELFGYDAEALNEFVGIPGWAENLQHVGWLVITPQSVTMPGFEKWMSKSAKRRLQDADRKRRQRSESPESTSAKCPQPVRKMSAGSVTREEKRREEKSNKDSAPDKPADVSPANGFKKPNPSQVNAYAKSGGYAVDGDEFCDFYSSKGWRVGREPMKDWQAAVRNWARRDNGRSGSRANPSEDDAQRRLQEQRDRDVKVY